MINSVTHAYDKDAEGTINIKTYQDGGDIVLEYSDDGKGISEKNLKEIFTPFFTTRRGSGGSGLGLSIVYNIITGTLKGRVTAESTQGHGVKFRFAFPAEL